MTSGVGPRTAAGFSSEPVASSTTRTAAAATSAAALAPINAHRRFRRAGGGEADGGVSGRLVIVAWAPVGAASVRSVEWPLASGATLGPASTGASAAGCSPASAAAAIAGVMAWCNPLGVPQLVQNLLPIGIEVPHWPQKFAVSMVRSLPEFPLLSAWRSTVGHPNGAEGGCTGHQS